MFGLEQKWVSWIIMVMGWVYTRATMHVVNQTQKIGTHHKRERRLKTVIFAKTSSWPPSCISSNLMLLESLHFSKICFYKGLKLKLGTIPQHNMYFLRAVSCGCLFVLRGQDNVFAHKNRLIFTLVIHTWRWRFCNNKKMIRTTTDSPKKNIRMQKT